MKTPIILLIKAELLAENFDRPLFTTHKISSLYVNRQLVGFMCRILSIVQEDKEKVLIRLKKLVSQILREPTKLDGTSYPNDIIDYLIRIKSEQKFYDPLKWLNSELEYWAQLNRVSNTEKRQNQSAEWLTREDFMDEFNMSTSSLNRRIAEGMPGHPMGSKLFFHRPEITKWLLDQEIKLEI